jgi:hypothetical protein
MHIVDNMDYIPFLCHEERDGRVRPDRHARKDPYFMGTLQI